MYKNIFVALLIFCGLMASPLCAQVQRRVKKTDMDGSSVVPSEAQQENESQEKTITTENDAESVQSEQESQTPVNPVVEQKIKFNPIVKRDPTLSQDDILILEKREKDRLAKIEWERLRKLEEERQKALEEERRRQLELELIKDPTRDIRKKIRIDGLIDKEVIINGKMYSVGSKVLGARIVEVKGDTVIFSYKGHRFKKSAI